MIISTPDKKDGTKLNSCKTVAKELTHTCKKMLIDV